MTKISLQDIQSKGIDIELVRCFSNLDEAHMLLGSINFPRERLPMNFENMRVFWSKVLALIDQWVIPENGDPFRSLLDAAFGWYQGSPYFNHERIREPPNPTVVPVVRVEGPDHTRFQFYDVPKSTPIVDIARKVICEYKSDAFRTQDGELRPAVVDRVNALNETLRLSDVERTLDDFNIQEEDTLHVSPEAVAGAVGPELRAEALISARQQITEFKNEHQGPPLHFRVFENDARMPTKHRFEFVAKSFAPPPPGSLVPVLIDQHLVEVLLPDDFPREAPLAFWKSPIYHPNVEQKTGFVCLGPISKQFYKPGLDFHVLCEMLVAIAQYRNYSWQQGFFNKPAAEWAFSSEGQLAIKERGGWAAIDRAALFHEGPLLDVKICNVDEIRKQRYQHGG